MIAVGNENKKIKNKYRLNYCHNMPMLSLLGANNFLPLFHMDNFFIWIEETEKRINEFAIGYMINPGLNVNKAFRDQVEKYMHTTFGEIIQSFIKAKFSKKNTSVLELIISFETEIILRKFSEF